MSLDSYAYAASPGDSTLVFALHGTGGDERQILPLAREIWPRATIVAPRGDVSEYGALRFFRRKAEGLYDFDDLARRTAAMAEFVRAHKARAAAGRVIGIGYSNGANILASVAFATPGLFDALALMHPLIPWRPADDPRLAATRVLITAGRRDPICPPPLTEALAEFWARQGADTKLEWHDGGHELRNSEIDALKLWGGEASASGTSPVG
jgi:phospholipase/carboxylesterase